MNGFRIAVALTAILLRTISRSDVQSTPLRAEDSACDPHLVQPSDDPQGYRLRGDRCEGIYVREVAGSLALVVVSFTESFEDFDPSSTKNIEIEWARFGSESIRLRAHGLTYKLHYRMDAIRSPEETTYVWSSNLLGALGIRKQDIGIVGRTIQSVNGTKREVYLPLRISQQANPARSPTYRLVLLPGEELKDVLLSLAQLGRDGRGDVYLQKDKPLGYSYYPAERPVSILLPELNTPGVYRLDIGAVLARGGSSAETIWFYHSKQ
jgi:hypothetical protein